MLMELFQIV